MLEEHQNMTLAVDTMHINKTPFIHCHDVKGNSLQHGWNDQRWKKGNHNEVITTSNSYIPSQRIQGM